MSGAVLFPANPNSGGGGSGVTSFNGRTGVVVPQSGDYTAAEVGALASGGTAVAAQNLSGGATLPDYLAPAVVALTDAATVAINSSLGNDFRLLMTSGVGASRQIGAPSSPVDGQRIVLHLQQPATGGPYTVTWNAVWDFGAAGAPTLSTGASKIDLIPAIYRADVTKWLAGSQLGY